MKKIIEKFKIKIKNMDLGKEKFNSAEMFLIVCMGIIFGVFLGNIFFSSNKITFQTEQKNNKLNEIEETYKKITTDYYKDIDEEKLKEAAINGMLSLLKDKHTSYFNEANAENFNTTLNGTFEGIGASIFKDEDGLATVGVVYKNSPAEKAGIKENDKFIKVDDKDVTNMAIDEISKLIKSKKEEITLVMQREKEEYTTKITTGIVEIPSVSSKIYEESNKKIGYIYISIFALNTDEQFEEELKKLEKQKIDSLIIDLRSNTGGHLDSTVNIASQFLNKKQIVCQIKNKENIRKIYSNTNSTRKYPIVVLVNNSSASGSEVLAAALQEEYKATLIGEKTYGKGTVQTTYKFSDGSMIKYTTESWLTSKGNSIDEKGITPDIIEKLNEEYYKTGEDKDDNQLQKAISVLKDK